MSNTGKLLLGGARIAGKSRTQSNNGETCAVANGDSAFQRVKQRTDYGSSTSNSFTTLNTVSNHAGFTGLSNLGNTCFMNCILQALANTSEIQEYFLSQKFRNDINTENPLGTKGRLARAFYVMLKNLWSGELKTYSPTKLKAIIDTCAPQFVGFLQHDAQEFMAFFLDALHEDINRVRNKPVFEIPQTENEMDMVIAEKIWKLHKSRNDSFIVDEFHGMYKSKLTCPNCSNISTTFDPFLFLPVPIPKPKRSITVILFRTKERPSSIQVTVPQASPTVSDIYSYIHCNVDSSIRSSCFCTLECNGGNIRRELSPTSNLVLSASSYFVVCEVSLNDENFTNVRVLQKQVEHHVSRCGHCGKCSIQDGVKVQRCAKCKRTGYCSQECQKSDWQEHRSKCRETYIGCPFMLCVDVFNTRCNDLLRFLHQCASFSIDGPWRIHNSNVLNSYDTCSNNEDAAEGVAVYISYNNVTRSRRIFQDGSPEPIDLQNVSHIIVEWGSEARTIPLSTSPEFDDKSTIQDCIKLFTEPEVLAKEESWYCPVCKIHVQATKELSLWKLPAILIVQLKRFSFRSRLWRDKINRLVDFPVYGLDVGPFCINDEEPNRLYDLYAVVNHHGGLFGGHYTAYVSQSGSGLSENNFGWRLCDDSNVTQVSDPSELVNEASYVLFYRSRCSTSQSPLNFQSMDEESVMDVSSGVPAVEIKSKDDTEGSHINDNEKDQTRSKYERLDGGPDVNSSLTSAPESPLHKFLSSDNASQSSMLDSCLHRKHDKGSPDIPAGRTQQQKQCTAPDLSVSQINTDLCYTDMDALD